MKLEEMKIFSCFLLFIAAMLNPAISLAGFVDHFTNPNDVGRYKVPHLGKSRILVIPVNLDTRHLKRLDIEAVKRFFKEKKGSFTFPGYWRDNSRGRFRVSADIARPVEFRRCPLPVSKKKCTPTRRDISALTYGIPLVRTIIRRAHKESRLDFRNYDKNGRQGKPDGWADGVIIIVNAGRFGVALPFGLVDGRYEMVIDGVRINMAAIASGKRALPMSVHEFGHLLGFADLYDEWRRTYGLVLSPMGTWGYSTGDVPLLDAFSKMRIGWAELEEVSGIREVMIPPAITGKVYKLGRGREFFLVENRQKKGVYDRNVGTPGLAVYHVNLDRQPSQAKYGFIKTVADCPNCRRFRPFVMNVQADRRYDLQYRLARFQPGDLFRTGDTLIPGAVNMRLSPSNPWFSSNAYSGRPTAVSITDIDSDSFLPNIRATLGAPVLDESSGEIRCRKGGMRHDGRCTEIKREDDGIAPSGGNLEAALGGLRAIPAFASAEAGCFLIDTKNLKLDWRIFTVLLLAAWLLLRKRFRNRHEKRLEEKAEGKENGKRNDGK